MTEMTINIQRNKHNGHCTDILIQGYDPRDSFNRIVLKAKLEAVLREIQETEKKTKK